MHGHRQPVAVHAHRLAHAERAVDGEAGREGVDHHPLARIDAAARLGQHQLHVGGLHLMPVDGHVHLHDVRARLARGDRHHHVLDRLAGHALGLVDGGADGRLGGLDVDHRAAAHAAVDPMADARDTHDVVVADPGDEAGHLGAAHIQGGQQAVAPGGHVVRSSDVR